MSDNFKVGDIVNLKSGSPMMTVTRVGTTNGEPTVWCVWFLESEQKSGTFPPGALESSQ
jgi:uncharacterized protein YodC (DUF2158 family)